MVRAGLIQPCAELPAGAAAGHFEAFPPDVTLRAIWERHRERGPALAGRTDPTALTPTACKATGRGDPGNRLVERKNKRGAVSKRELPLGPFLLNTRFFYSPFHESECLT